jgi:hypothetical protein
MFREPQHDIELKLVVILSLPAARQVHRNIYSNEYQILNKPRRTLNCQDLS